MLRIDLFHDCDSWRAMQSTLMRSILKVSRMVAHNYLRRVCHRSNSEGKEKWFAGCDILLASRRSRFREAQNDCLNWELMNRPGFASTASHMQGDTADGDPADRFQLLQSVLAPRGMRDAFGPRVEKA